MHPVQATAPRFVRLQLLLKASRSAASNSACISSSTHASSSSSFSHISNHRRTLFTTKHSAMSAAGHGTIERRFEKHGPVRGTPAPSPHSLDLDQHRVDRPDIKASYIDTHCHMFTTLSIMKAQLWDKSIPENRVDLLARRLFPPNVKAVIDIHCDLPVGDYHEQALNLMDWPEDFTYYFAAGAHPHVAMDYTEEAHRKFINLMSHPRCVAWGECGLDFFKNKPYKHEKQREVFIRQIEAAVSLRKPIIIHTREADAAMQEVLDKHMPRDYVFHMHCFASSRELGRWVLETFPNSYLGITGVASYKLPSVHDLIRSGELPLSRMLMETDAPFMTPKNIYKWTKQTRSGNQAKKKFVFCHSGMIPFTAEVVADLINEGREARGEAERTNVEEVLKTTRKNAEKVYRIELGDETDAE